jgi:D-alanine-D-alanine ligase
MSRIAVLMGGMSAERVVSLKSGKAVLAALKSRGWNALSIDVGPDLPSRLSQEGVEVAWLALHGQFGEDGCIQGLLEIMRIPYTGSSVQASAAAMDKITTKRLLAGTGIPMPRDWAWTNGESLPEGVQYPVVAKTPQGGSTLGILMVGDEAELELALVDLAKLDRRVLLEERIEGTEITVAVLDGQALPAVEIVPDSGFFDFEAKYTEGCTQYLVPARISDLSLRAAQSHAVTACELLGLTGIVRVDFIVRTDGTPVFLEVNTIPGMTATSLSPMAAAAVGISFEDLVDRVAQSARLHLVRQDDRQDIDP